MTSVAVPLHHFEQDTTEIFETDIYHETFEDTEDQEMTDSDPKQTFVEYGYEDQDTYNADIESTVVEPPQSDAVLTHAPSTILDEMEYLDEIDYEEADPDSKPPPEVPLIHEIDDTYKVFASSNIGMDVDYFQEAETTTAHTPPAHSPEDQQHLHHPQMFSPASRIIPLLVPLLHSLLTISLLILQRPPSAKTMTMTGQYVFTPLLVKNICFSVPMAIQKHFLKIIG